MKTTLYSATVPQLIGTLTKLQGILAKAQAFMAEKGLEDEAVLAWRLYDDMFPLVRQVQIACDNAKAFPVRLGVMEQVPMADDETEVEELVARIEKVILLLKGVSEADINAKEDAEVTLPYFPGKKLSGFNYAFEYLMPNFYFHVVTAYDILRHNGVPLGKSDYRSLTLEEA